MPGDYAIDNLAITTNLRPCLFPALVYKQLHAKSAYSLRHEFPDSHAQLAKGQKHWSLTSVKVMPSSSLTYSRTLLDTRSSALSLRFLPSGP